MTRARKTSALLAAGLLSLGACGGGGDDAAGLKPAAAAPGAGTSAVTGSPPSNAPSAGPTGDAAAITELARYVVLSEESPGLCRDKFSAKFVGTVFRSVTRCERAMRQQDKDPSDDTVDVRVTDVKVSGLAATATITEYMRDKDSATGTWAFIRAGDQWRVAAWGVDYLRSGFRTVFGPTHTSKGVDDVMSHAPTRSCVGEWVERRDDESLTRLAYGLFRNDKRVVEEMQDQVVTCAAAPDATGVSALRRVFEHHLRADVTKKVGPEIAECGIRRTRAAITDEHLAEMERADKVPAWLERRLRNIGLDCALDQVRAAPGGGARNT